LTLPAYVEPERFVQQITTGDSNVVKNLLDDHAYEHLTNIGRYIEDHRLGNVKLALMGVSCVVASIAQFYEKIDTSWAFPANRTLLCICVAL
jgi:hypothetical protein